MNDIVVLICAVILLVALLPMFLMRAAFKGAAAKGKGAGEASRGDSGPDGGDSGGGGK
jgi:hypothetical protein